MAVYYCQWFFVALSAFVLIQTATSLRCFVCSTQSEECGDPYNITKHTADTCDSPGAVCLKQIVAPYGKIHIHRGCVEEEYCKFFEEASKHCSTCKKDFCNSSPTVYPSFMALAPMICFYMCKYLLR